MYYKKYQDFKDRVDSIRVNENTLVDLNSFLIKNWNYKLQKDFNPKKVTVLESDIESIKSGFGEEKDYIKIFQTDEPYYVSEDLQIAIKYVSWKSFLSVLKRQLIVFQKLNHPSTEDDVEYFLYLMCKALYVTKRIDLDEDLFQGVVDQSLDAFTKLIGDNKFEDSFQLIDWLKEWKEKTYFIPSSGPSSSVGYAGVNKLEIFNSVQLKKKSKSISQIIGLIHALKEADMFISKETILDHCDESIGVRKLDNVIRPRRKLIDKHNRELFGTVRYSKYNKELSNRT